MPEQPVKTRRRNFAVGQEPPNPSDRAERVGQRFAVRYAELRCKTNFSFLRGASHPDELVAQAIALGYAALAVTDVETLAGVVRFHSAAKPHNFKVLIGAELHPLDAPPICLYAMQRAGYGRLTRIITQGRLRRRKGECEIHFDDIAALADGLIGMIINCRFPISDFRLETTHRHQSEIGNRQSEILRYRDVFGDRLYLGVSLHGGPDDERDLAACAALSRSTRVPLVANNDVHYHEPGRRFLQDVLTCIREKCTLDEAGTRLFANAERHLKPADQMLRLFAEYPDAIGRTLEIAQRCTFSLDELRYEYPEELCPPDQTPMQYLAELTWAGAREKSPGNGVPPKIRALIEHELKLIEELRYEAYFLTVWDLVRFARSRGILCQGRGSAANSAVCYCLGITSVDPERIDLLFERFVSRERNEPPDIDVDFEHERREEVFQYIYEKYGRERAGITAEVITYRPRSAVRDIGKALGLSLDRVGVLAKQLEFWSESALPEDRIREAGLDPSDRTVQMLIALVTQIMGFPRHLSQHVGGFVMTHGPLCELVPIENGAMPARTFIEWDKDDIDELGILKVDCLALGMMTAISKCLKLVNGDGQGEGQLPIADCRLPISPGGTVDNSPGREPWVDDLPGDAEPRRGDSTAGWRLPCGSVISSGADLPASVLKSRIGNRKSEMAGQSAIRNLQSAIAPRLALSTIPAEDPAVYDMICAADTVGVFQIESRAQMSMLPRLRPRCFYDLVIEVAIVRPGPIQGGMVHPYLRRRNGEEPVNYPSPEIRAVLEKTLGVPLFQEQAMRLAVVAAGFTPGEADQLRRAMGAWRRSGVIEKFRIKLLEGMKANGLPEEFAQRCFQQISGFGEYGFPESHAASFALLVYVSAWLKHYYPAEFCAALLNSQPMGFYAPAQLVRDALQHGVEVRRVDVNFSDYDCTLERFQISDFRVPIGCEASSQVTNGGTSENSSAFQRWDPDGDGSASAVGTAERASAVPTGLGRLSGHSNPSDESLGYYHSAPPARCGAQSEIGNRKSEIFHPAVRLGLRQIKGMSPAKVAPLVRARQEGGPFRSIDDLVRRSGVSRALLARLAAADAFRSMGLDRRAALWRVLAVEDEQLPLFAGLERQEPPAPLPPQSLDEQVIHDYDTVGLSLTAHPMSLLRDELSTMHVIPSERLQTLRQGMHVRVAGLVLVRQRPSTAGGILFVTLEDETGIANLIIRPLVYERYRAAARIAVALIADGRVERQGEVIHIQVSHLTDLSERWTQLRSPSRDFH